MDDLISRKAAVDAISCNIIVTGRQNAELVAQTIGRFADRIKALPSVKPERWIPVSEKLPEKTGKYLVTVKNGNVYATAYCAMDKKFNCAAVAWMDLPEPYKEDDQAILYECDPKKNKACRKTACYKRGGECHLTTHVEYAVDDKEKGEKHERFNQQGSGD